MTFRLYNTLTRQVEPVQTRHEGMLRVYSCGPTVYSYAHIGNFRTFLTTDLLLRTAHAIGLQTRYVSNITDVGHLSEDDVADSGGEDRMAKALELDDGKRFANVWSLADYFTSALLEDWKSLNLHEPDVRPRATQHMREQILAIEELIETGHAYETEDAVYFSVPSFPRYGRLSGNTDASSLEEGVRDVVRDDRKRDQRDFALWKKDDKHLMQWFSPWGWGFPGWHLECSVMAKQYLGESIDIHAGGEDLIFPHHECEIAQAECVSDETFARHWVHTRFLQVEGKKMSKSAGNYLVPRELMESVEPLALRYALISGHYRKPFNFTHKNLDDSSAIVARLKAVAVAAGSGEGVVEKGEVADPELTDELERAYVSALEGMCDDLNTPRALAATVAGLKSVERRNELNGPDSAVVLDWLEKVNQLLGIVSADGVRGMAEAHRHSEGGQSDDAYAAAAIEALVEERVAARASKDWGRADEIRDQLAEMGVVLKDGPEGTTWSKA